MQALWAVSVRVDTFSEGLPCPRELVNSIIHKYSRLGNCVVHLAPAGSFARASHGLQNAVPCFWSSLFRLSSSPFSLDGRAERKV